LPITYCYSDDRLTSNVQAIKVERPAAGFAFYYPKEQFAEVPPQYRDGIYIRQRSTGHAIAWYPSVFVETAAGELPIGRDGESQIVDSESKIIKALGGNLLKIDAKKHYYSDAHPAGLPFIEMEYEPKKHLATEVNEATSKELIYKAVYILPGENRHYKIIYEDYAKDRALNKAHIELILSTFHTITVNEQLPMSPITSEESPSEVINTLEAHHFLLFIACVLLSIYYYIRIQRR
jgi:hypothetical protein